MEIRPTYRYSNYTPEVKLTNNKGTFSRYDSNSNTIYIGDGESATLDITIKEQLANIEIKSVTFNDIRTTADKKVKKIDNGSTNKRNVSVTLSDEENDIVKEVYRIKEAWLPHWYNLTIVYNDVNKLINALKTNFKFLQDKDKAATNRYAYYVIDTSKYTYNDNDNDDQFKSAAKNSQMYGWFQGAAGANKTNLKNYKNIVVDGTSNNTCFFISPKTSRNMKNENYRWQCWDKREDTFNLADNAEVLTKNPLLNNYEMEKEDFESILLFYFPGQYDSGDKNAIKNGLYVGTKSIDEENETEFKNMCEYKYNGKDNSCGDAGYCYIPPFLLSDIIGNEFVDASYGATKSEAVIKEEDIGKLNIITNKDNNIQINVKYQIRNCSYDNE